MKPPDDAVPSLPSHPLRRWLGWLLATHLCGYGVLREEAAARTVAEVWHDDEMRGAAVCIYMERATDAALRRARPERFHPIVAAALIQERAARARRSTPAAPPCDFCGNRHEQGEQCPGLFTAMEAMRTGKLVVTNVNDDGSRSTTYADLHSQGRES